MSLHRAAYVARVARVASVVRDASVARDATRTAAYAARVASDATRTAAYVASDASDARVASDATRTDAYVASVARVARVARVAYVASDARDAILINSRPPKPMPTELPILPFKTQRAFAAWLKKHHAQSPGLWLKLVRQGAGPSVTYAQALEEALCYGWIDGQKKGFDDTSWLQKFTPRGPRSIWSKINRDKALALIAAGRVQPAGLAAIAAAQKNGRWEAAYDSQRTAALPADFQAELDRRPRAKAFYATLNSVNRYAIIFRLHSARKPETRARRLAQYLDMLENGEKLHP